MAMHASATYQSTKLDQVKRSVPAKPNKIERKIRTGVVSSLMIMKFVRLFVSSCVPSLVEAENRGETERNGKKD